MSTLPEGGGIRATPAQVHLRLTPQPTATRFSPRACHGNGSCQSSQDTSHHNLLRLLRTVGIVDYSHFLKALTSLELRDLAFSQLHSHLPGCYVCASLQDLHSLPIPTTIPLWPSPRAWAQVLPLSLCILSSEHCIFSLGFVLPFLYTLLVLNFFPPA